MNPFDTLSVLSRPAMEQPLPIAWVMVVSAFAGGATLGSFLNVVIARVPVGLSVVHPRSRCPSCLKQIAWYDNVPVFSWLLLRARCRACKATISARYPFVELCMGLLTSGLVLRFGYSWPFAELMVFAATLVVVAFIDLDTWEIPLVFPAVLAVVGLAAGVMGDLGEHAWRSPQWLLPALLDPGSGALERGVGLLAGFFSLASINVVATYIARRRGVIDPGEFAMGWGDPILVAGMGAVLGWRALPWVIFLASFQGAVVGLALRFAGKMPAQSVASTGTADTPEGEWVPPPSALPFGPFLAIAGLEVAFFGQHLAGWSSAVFKIFL